MRRQVGTVALVVGLALGLAPATARAQNFLINPCGGSNICFGSGSATDVFVVTDGAKRIKFKFDGTEITPETTGVTSLGTSTRQFLHGEFSGTVTATNFVGTFTGPGAFTFINVDHGTVTADTQPTVDTTVTWNSGAVTFTANKTNVTDTASASASLLEDWQVGGSSKASVRKDGLLTGLGLSAGTSGVATPFVNATHGTVTVNTQPTWNGTVTWNSGAVSFFGIKLDVTNTASAATSKLIDLQVGGVTQFNVTRAGNVTSTGTYSGTTITGSLIASTADVQTGATGRYLIDNRLILSASGTGKAVIANWNGDAGVSFDLTTDGTAFVKTRADADTATVKANALTATGTITGSGRTVLDGTTTSTGAGAVGITGSIHEITTTGTGDALTLADGAEGQRITIVYVAEGAGTDTAVLTPTNFGSGATITFSVIGQSARLIFTNGKWYCDGAPFGAVVA